jgi:hypothetical protein
MKIGPRVLWLAAGITAGLIGGWLLFNQPPPVFAGNDRHEDYVIATGPASVGLVGPDLDGVWLLDYRAGKLLGTVVNRVSGKIGGWAEVDLVKEFNIPPRSNVHFMMTTGQIARGQAALYVAETQSGRFGVYTMLPGENGALAGGVQIRRHDMVSFRANAAQPPQPGPVLGGQ